MSSVDLISNAELTILKRSLDESYVQIKHLKEALNEMVLSKQYLVNDLHKTKFSNAKLSKQMQNSTEENTMLKLEIERIKLHLQSMQRSLHVSNRKLARHMRGCAETRIRLCEMFLRMRSTKFWHERRRNRYQQMCLQFAEFVREQNRYMLATMEAKLSNESITACHRQYLDLLTRCSQLLHENMNLRLLAMNKLDGEQNSPQSAFVADKEETSEEDCVTTGSDEVLFKRHQKAPQRKRHHSI